MIKFTLTLVILLLFSCAIAQDRVCSPDSTISFIYRINGKNVQIENNYTIYLKGEQHATHELDPVCSRDADSSLERCYAYVTFPNVSYDSSSVLTFLYDDLKISMKFLSVCQNAYAGPVEIYRYTNKTKYKRRYGSKHPITGKDIKRKDFPITRAEIWTIETTEEIEIVE